MKLQPNQSLEPTRVGKPPLAAQLQRYGSLSHRPPTVYKELICAALLSLSFGGWAQVSVTSYANKPVPASDSPEYIDVVETVVQVCLPNRKAEFRNVQIELSGIPEVDPLAVQRARNGIKDHRTDYPNIDCIGGERIDTDVARRWIPSNYPNGLQRYFLQFGHVVLEDGMFSAGSGAIGLIGNTSKSQPVYEALGRPIGTYVAVEVGPVSGSENAAKNVSHWYTLPSHIPQGSYTEWISPVAAEDRDAPKRVAIFWRLTHGQTLQPTEVAPDAPRVRVTAATVREHYDRSRCWLRTRRAVAEQYYRPVVGTPLRDQVHFVPKFNRDLPPC